MERSGEGVSRGDREGSEGAFTETDMDLQRSACT